MTTSAAGALQVALVAALEADSVLGALLATPTSIFSQRAPQDAVMPYLVVGSSIEVPAPAFGRERLVNDETIHIWSGKQDKLEVLEIYKELARVLGARLTVTGFTATRGRTRLVGTMTDPGDATHGIVQYTASHHG